MADLLDEFGSREISIFKDDLTQLMRVTKGIDKYYAIQHPKLDKYMPLYGKLIESFNKKYSNLHAKPVKTPSSLNLKLFVKEGDVKNIFSSVAVRIIGIKSVGANGFGKSDVTKAEELGKELEKIKNKVYISYYHQERGSDTILLEYNPRVKMTEVLYDQEGIVNDESPEFKIVAFYALKSFNPKIDVFIKSAALGFVDLLSEDEKKEWLGKFNPRLEE